MNVYRPYLTLYPETRFVDLLQERYKVGETRLMTVEQLEEFLTWMEAGVAQGKSLAKPGAGSSSGSGPAGGPGPDNAPEAREAGPGAAPAPGAGAKSPAAAPGASKARGTGPTEAQRKRLFAIMKQCAWNEEQMRDYMAARFGIQSTQDLTKTGYDALVSVIEGGDFDSAMQAWKDGEGDGQESWSAGGSTLAPEPHPFRSSPSEDAQQLGF